MIEDLHVQNKTSTQANLDAQVAFPPTVNIVTAGLATVSWIPNNMNYALHEALRLVLEEGLENRWRRHQENHQALKECSREVGLEIASQEGHQLWQLNAVTVPEGADEAAVRKKLLNDHNIEVGAGLGPLKGKIWRVGLMGETSTHANVKTFLESLRSCLKPS